MSRHASDRTPSSSVKCARSPAAGLTAAWLSQWIVVGVVGSGKSSKMSLRSQMASLATCVAATYSASAVDSFEQDNNSNKYAQSRRSGF